MKKIFLTFIMTTLIIGIQSCAKFEDFGDTNNNPEGIGNATYSGLLTNSILSLPYGGNNVINNGISSNYTNTNMGLYCQYISQTQYTDISLYSTPQTEFSGLYAGILQDLNIIIKAEDGQVTNNMKQVAKILQQTSYWYITNTWGDVPYSQALIALENTQPVYDTQEAIYNGILAELKAAVGAIDASGIPGDIIYGGDAASWKKFGNSMRMLVSIHLAKKFPNAGSLAANEFAAALADAGGSIETNTQNFTIAFPGGNYRHPLFNLYNGRKDFGESKTMTDLMASLGDARQDSFGGANQDLTAPDGSSTSNVGVPYGVARAKAEAFTGANTNWARILKGTFRQENSPWVIVSAGQILLARAEAAERGWTTEDPAALYKKGIEASHAQWNVTAASSYLTSTSIALGAKGTAGNLYKIILQEYISTYPNGYFGWLTYRRAGVPNLTPAIDATNASKQIPRRFTYGTTEFSSNGTNVLEAINRLNGTKVDTQDDKIWWDK